MVDMYDEFVSEYERLDEEDPQETIKLVRGGAVVDVARPDDRIVVEHERVGEGQYRRVAIMLVRDGVVVATAPRWSALILPNAGNAARLPQAAPAA